MEKFYTDQHIRRIRSSILISVLYFTGFTCTGQSVSYFFPGEEWEVVDDPATYGYDKEALKRVEDFARDSILTAAYMIIDRGRLISQWGDVDVKFNTHSIRKSFLSALYGIYVKDGTIDMEATMEDLGIDDEPPLSKEEKQATVRDLLKSRSGIYHPALYESQGMKDLKPARFTEKAGIHWYYNNWDFNASGTIFETLTGKGIFDAISDHIAIPTGMQDFLPSDGTYVNGEESIHAAYPFRVTARDLGRFGLLMLNNGKWKETQLIPEEWVKESTRYHSDATLYSSDGYGYMWWVARDYNKFPHLPNAEISEGSYSARGAGGHYIMIIPEKHLVIIHRVNTDIRNRVSTAEAGKLFQLILDAKEE